MKKCVKCNKEMADESRFCPRCGEDQAVIESPSPEQVSTNAPQENKPWITAQTLSSADTAEKIYKVALVGVGLTGLSVLMPMLRVIGVMEFTIMDYSKFLALVIIGLCVFMGHEIIKKNYALPAVISQGLLVYFIIIYVRYSNAMSDMHRGYGSIVNNAVYLEWGTYIFIVCVIMTCLASILYGIASASKSFCAETLISQWKEYVVGTVKLHTINLPGYAWIIAITVILLVITQQANPFRNF